MVELADEEETVNDDELRAWHRAEADRTHAIHLENARRAHEQHTRPPVNPHADIQRAQQAYWDHEARTRRPTDNLLQRDAQYQARPSQRSQEQLNIAHRDFLDARYGYNRPAAPPTQTQVHHHWWQVWKR